MLRLLKWSWTSAFSSATTSLSLLALGISPLGGVALFLWFSIFGFCKGGLGSGVSCNLPILNSYYETIGALGEISCFLAGACLLWLALGVIIWLSIPVYIARSFLLLVKAKDR